MTLAPNQKSKIKNQKSAMRFSSLFDLNRKPQPLPIAADPATLQLPIAADSLGQPTPAAAPTGTNLGLSAAIGSEIDFSGQSTWFLPTQIQWVQDPSPLRIWEKSRQVGATKTDAFDSVLKASPDG